jgi:hypothetical protein
MTYLLLTRHSSNPNYHSQSHTFYNKTKQISISTSISKMKLTTTTLALPLLAAAAPTTQPAPANPPFSVMAIRSGSPIHYSQLNAAGQKFWLGGETATYCPEVVPNCPPGTQTVLAPGGGSLVSRETYPFPCIFLKAKHQSNCTRTPKSQAANKSTSTPPVR